MNNLHNMKIRVLPDDIDNAILYWIENNRDVYPNWEIKERFSIRNNKLYDGEHVIPNGWNGPLLLDRWNTAGQPIPQTIIDIIIRK